MNQWLAAFLAPAPTSFSNKPLTACLARENIFLRKSGNPWVVSGSNKVLPDVVVEMVNVVRQVHLIAFVAQIKATSSL